MGEMNFLDQANDDVEQEKAKAEAEAKAKAETKKPVTQKRNSSSNTKKSDNANSKSNNSLEEKIISGKRCNWLFTAVPMELKKYAAEQAKKKKMGLKEYFYDCLRKNGCDKIPDYADIHRPIQKRIQD